MCRSKKFLYAVSISLTACFRPSEVRDEQTDQVLKDFQKFYFLRMTLFFEQDTGYTQHGNNQATCLSLLLVPYLDIIVSLLLLTYSIYFLASFENYAMKVIICLNFYLTVNNTKKFLALKIINLDNILLL